jgi:hypothetical protein
MTPRKAIQRSIKIKADSQGNPPARIHLMGAGHWHAPWHGNFEMTPEDLAEMVQHFDEGVGSVEGSKKLPVNYGHDVSGKAAGWITKLSVENNGTELWGDVEWTPEGERMLAEGSFRYISPEWNPRSFPYQDPEDEDTWLNNVFTGAGLTNIPLFKKLKPIMASLVQPKVQRASVKVGESNNNKGVPPMALKLEEVRTKEADKLSAEEKTFLEEHKTDLTASELESFGLKADDAPAPEAAPEADPTPAPEGGVQGSAKTGQLSDEEITQLKADAAAGRAAAQELAETKAKGFIASAVTKGQIKTGDSDGWTGVLLASTGESRTKLEKLIEGLPVNASLGKEEGDAGITSSDGAKEELHTKVAASIKASAEKGKVVSYYQARKEVLAADTALAARIKEAEKENQQ